MRIGGTLEQSLSQGYRLELQGVLKEAWQQTRRTGFGLALAIAGVMAIWILLSNTLLAPYVSQEGGDMDMALILSLLITVIMSPMTSSLDMLGLQQSVGVRARPNQVFDFFRHFLRLGSLSLLGSLITSLFGPLLEMLFTVPLVLERGLSPAQAILVSLKLFARGWPSIVLLHGVMLALFFLAIIPMGIGLIWVAPLYFNLKGILYRDLCGVAVEVTEVADNAATGQGPDHFNA